MGRRSATGRSWLAWASGVTRRRAEFEPRLGGDDVDQVRRARQNFSLKAPRKHSTRVVIEI